MSGWYVTANDIKKWTTTKKREAEETLPQLVKKLVLASCKPKSLTFPSGDSVAIGGWDGILDVEEGNEFIPVGKSGWEFGTNVDVMKKADEDYEKRTKNSEPFTIDESTFVFVTSRLWTKNNDWVKAKKAQGKWKDVKGMDAETLQSWLECCPAVHRWFANLIGKRTSDLWDIEQAWNTLSNVTKYALTPDIFLTGRDKERVDLLNKLESEASVLRVKAQSEMESYGFILSTLMNEDKYTARILIVKNQPTWDWLMNFDHPLLLIPDNFTPNGIGEAVTKGHHVIIAIDSMDSAGTTIELKRMSRQNRINAIKSIGFSEDKAEQLYKETKGYLEPLIRHKMLIPNDFKTPGWVEKVNSDVLFSVLLASEWDENNPNDKEIMSNLSGLAYDAFEKNVIELSKQSDPPVRLVGNIWQVISKVDMWLQIARRLAKPHLARLGEASQKVLKDLDLSFNLAPEELFMANIKGIVPLYSEKLKKGIADSLALLSTYEEDYAYQLGSIKPSDFVKYWVFQLFEGSVAAVVWYSLRDCLEAIAEAAPDEFIAALEKSMYGNEPPVIKEFFLAEGYGCPHSHLLYALERISWNKQYLTKISICLARLSEIDPGGRYRDRPFASLKNIFFGLINNTRATYLERLQIIKHVLLEQFPDITWKLMVSLLHGNNDGVSFLQKPKYREWAEDINENILKTDYGEYIREIVEILFMEVDNNIGKRLPDLLANFGSYYKEQKEAFFAKLINIDPNSLENDDREEIIKKIRGILHDHRKFSDANWAFPEVLLEKLENVYHHFEFADIIKKNIYLFESQHPLLIKPTNRKEIDYDEMNKIIAAKRIEVIEEIFNTRGMEGIKELAHACKSPVLICSALTQSKYSEQVIPEILSWLGSDGQLNVFATSYLSTKNHKDFDSAQRILEENQEWDNNKKSSFLLSMPKTGKTFKLVEKQCNDVQRKYWNSLQCDDDLSEIEKRQIPYVAKKFLENERPVDAITLIAQVLWSKQEIDNLESSLVADILMKIVSAPSDIDRVPIQFARYDILKAIKLIQFRADLPVEKIFQIEFVYLKMFCFGCEGTIFFCSTCFVALLPRRW